MQIQFPFYSHHSVIRLFSQDQSHCFYSAPKSGHGTPHSSNFHLPSCITYQEYRQIPNQGFRIDPLGMHCSLSSLISQRIKSVFIEKIIQETKRQLGENVSLVIGGFHLLPYSSEYASSITRMVKEDLEVRRVAPTHCTGDTARAIFKEIYQEDYLYFGLGTKLPLP